MPIRGTPSIKPVASNVISNLQSIGNLSLEGSDFTLSSYPTKRTNGFIAGPTGCGKSSTVLRYCPDPIVMLYYDDRSEAAIQEARDLGKVVLDLNLKANKVENTTREQLKSEARNILELTKKNIRWAVNKSLLHQVKTICIDGGTELDDILDLAFDGVEDERQQIYGKDKGYRKKKWREIFELISLGNAHFIITVRAKEIWETVIVDSKKKQQASGKYSYYGVDTIGELCQWGVLQTRRKSPISMAKTIAERAEEKKNRRNVDVEDLLQFEVIKSGRNGKELDAIYDATDWRPVGGNPFSYICQKQNEFLFPGCTVEDWQK
jgi:hypothetical protein